MIEEVIVELFNRLKHTWTIGGKEAQPTTEDVTNVLDHAAEKLTGEPNLTVLTTGGLKIEKNERGKLDVYVHVGEYI